MPYVNLAYENNSDSPDDTQQNSDDPQMNKIQEMGSVLTNNGKHKIHCLTIIGQIEGHYVLPSQNKTTKYEHIIPQLVAIEEEPEDRRDFNFAQYRRRRCRSRAGLGRVVCRHEKANGFPGAWREAILLVFPLR